ncbi:MAG: TPM domain-containing protein [Bacteroidota bacterium]
MAQTIFTQQEQDTIEEAIRKAELETSGEIRVHIESSCEGNVLDRAAQVFAKLEMHKTEARNGVLFYLSHRDHKFAVLGDVGINSRVNGDFWDDIKIKMQIRFRGGHFVEGLVDGINMAGEQLRHHFPWHELDNNELSDKISFGDE